MKNLVLRFLREEEGVETVEMVILMVVIVGIAVVFRKQLVEWFNAMLQQAQANDFSKPAIGEVVTPS